MGQVNDNSCRECRHFQAIEPELIEYRSAAESSAKEGHCLLHVAEVTEHCVCADYEPGERELPFLA